MLTAEFLEQVGRDYLAVRDQLVAELRRVDATATEAEKITLRIRIGHAGENAEDCFMRASRVESPRGNFCSVCRRWHGSEKTHAAE